MNYIYDVILNFTDNYYYDFYEWSNNDNLINVRKVPIIKVDKDTLYDFMNYIIKIDESLLKLIENQSIFLRRDKHKYDYSLILSNGEKSIGLCFNKNGNVLYKSAMLLDEEEEANKIALNIKTKSLLYKKYDNNCNNLLRCDLRNKNKILQIIKNEYYNKEYDRLKYIYYEVYKVIPNNIELAYNKLIKEIDNNIYSINNIFNSLNIK